MLLWWANTEIADTACSQSIATRYRRHTPRTSAKLDEIALELGILALQKFIFAPEPLKLGGSGGTTRVVLGWY